MNAPVPDPALTAEPTTRDLARKGLSDVGICLAKGWGPGTRLVGDEGSGPSIIHITALGASSILAVLVSHNGKTERDRTESLWTLRHRDWIELPS